MALLRLARLIPLVLVLLVSSSVASRHPRQNKHQFTEAQKKYLYKIQVLAREGGLPKEEWKSVTEYDPEVCYEISCLKSALEIVTATNFTVNPCEPKKWLNFACSRRVNGPDNINQVERLMKLVDGQTRRLLNDDSGKMDGDLLFKEAQTYYFQCKYKALRDSDDVKDILEYSQQKYGGWPIMTNRVPDKNFDWMGMVADQNRLERFGYQPLIFKVTTGDEGLKLSMGRITFPYSATDLMELLSRVQKNSGRRKPARIEQLRSMLQYMNTINVGTVNRRSAERTMTIKTLQDITIKAFKNANEELFFDVNWLQFFKRVLEGSGVQVSEDTPVTLPLEHVINALEVTNNFYKGNDIKAVSNALNFQLISTLLQESTTLLDDLKTFSCLEETGTRERICLTRTTEYFGYSLGKTYLKAFYDDDKMTPAIMELMGNIQEGYVGVIEKLPLMEPKTKVFLKDKIRSMKTYIAEPDWTKDPAKLKKFYKGLSMSTDKNGSYPLNFLNMMEWVVGKKKEWQQQLADIEAGGDLSSSKLSIYDVNWSRYLGTVQAQFFKLNNQARIEGGIVQAPLFVVDRPAFMNYGSLGMVLAHEIGHSLDTGGRLYNKNGQKGEFWDKLSVQRYNNWTQTIAADYGSEAHQVSDTSAETIDAGKTLDEDIADILGVYISFYSYQEYLKKLDSKGEKEKILPGLKSFTPQKLFYMKYANMWCDKKDVQDHYTELFSDHSGGNVRATLPLKRSAQFAQTFGCEVPEGHDK